MSYKTFAEALDALRLAPRASPATTLLLRKRYLSRECSDLFPLLESHDISKAMLWTHVDTLNACRTHVLLSKWTCDYEAYLRGLALAHDAPPETPRPTYTLGAWRTIIRNGVPVFELSRVPKAEALYYEITPAEADELAHTIINALNQAGK